MAYHLQKFQCMHLKVRIKGWTPTGSVPEKYDPMMVVALP